MHAVTACHDVHSQNPGDDGQDAGQQACPFEGRRREVPA
jgi:hypothetical protein